MRIHRFALHRILSVLTVLALLFSLGADLFGGVYAGALSSRKDTLETSVHATASKHTFVFTTATALTADGAVSTPDFSFKFYFPYDVDSDAFTIPAFVAGDASASCTSCGTCTLAVADLVELSEGGAAGTDSVLATMETDTSCTSLPIGSVVTFQLGTGATKATNMSDITSNDHGCIAGAATTNADICPITAKTTESTTNPITEVDSGKVLVGLITGITVSATVAETLSFSIGATSVGLGELNTSAVSTQTLTSTVSTNAQGGYVSTIQDDKTGTVGLASNGNNIDDTAGGTIVAGEEEYGVATSKASQTITQDTDCPTTPYNASAATNSPQSYASASGPVSSDQATLCFAASVTALTPTGSYSNTTTLIATPTF